MKKSVAIITFCLFTASLQFVPWGNRSLADTGEEFVAVPPFITAGAPPLVMLAMGRDHKLYYEAYNDASDLDEDGMLEVRYKPSIDYYGYFDSYKCYDYDATSNTFVPTSVNTNKKCIGSGADDKWSGNFLNYITMARMDAIRKVLYGGYRSTDTVDETVLQRTLIPQDAHSWGKEYTSIDADGYDIADYTPFTEPLGGTRHLFANTTAGGYDQPPLLRYALNNRNRIWTWVSRAAPQGIPRAVQIDNETRPSLPANHAQFEALVLTYAVGNRHQGTMPWQSYDARNKQLQKTPSPSATNFGAIDGAGNPFKPATYGPTTIHPSSVYQSGHAEQNGYMLIFTGILHVTTGGSYSFGVDGDDSVEVIVNGGTPQERIVGYYGTHGRANMPMCQKSNGAGGACAVGNNAEPVTLSAGTYRVEFRFMEDVGGDMYYLYWKGPDSGDAWKIVPSEKFTDLTVSGYDMRLPKSLVVERHVKVKVCDPTVGLEANCRQYPNGKYKPIGLLQERGEKEQMYFGLMTGSYAKNASGGVLRKRIGSINDEIEAATGIFNTTIGSAGSIIRTIDKLRIYGYTYAIENPGPGVAQPSNANHYGADNCGWIVTPLYNNAMFLNGQAGSSAGRCSDWGNPIAEIMYESIRYFAGKKKATTAFDYGHGANIKDNILGLPKAAWNDPYDKSAGGFDYCSKPFLLVLSDINPSYDTDQLPGVEFSGSPAFAGDLSPAMKVGELARSISQAEGLSGKKFIGQSGTESDDYCSAKDMTAWGLGAFRGLCPEEPTKRGGYYAASVAYYGKTTDVNVAQGDQNVTTFAVALASPLPEIKVYLGPQKKLITLVPFGKTVGTLGRDADGKPIGIPWPEYMPTNTIVDFYVEEISPTHGNFQINFEDVEQGADHDMDALVTYEYWLVDNSGNEVTSPEQATRLKVTLTSTQAAGSYIQHMGYIISGTTADGPYLEVRDMDTSEHLDISSKYDTPPNYTSPPGANSGLKLPQQTTRVFTPGGGASTASLLKDPLWYAGKWGGFEDKNDNKAADLTDEWDKDLNGVPDNYFFVVNPLKLEQELRKAFDAMANQAASGTTVSVSTDGKGGEGALYQATFFPELADGSSGKITWAGEVRGVFIDTKGRLREDSNGNGRIDTRGPDLNGDGRVVHEDVNMNCLLDQETVPTVDWNGDGIINLKDLVTEDSNGNGILDTEYAACHPATTPDTDAFLSALDAIIINQSGGGVARYYDINGNGVLDPQEIKYNVAGPVQSARDLRYLWSSTSWLNAISNENIKQQRSNYISDVEARYIFTWVDKPNASGGRNGLVDNGEVQDFSWNSGTTVAGLADSGSFYSYLNLYPSFGNRPLAIDNLASDATRFGKFLLKQTERQVNWLRGLDEVDANNLPVPLVLDNQSISGTELRSRQFAGQTWRLGDIVYSSPITVAAPMEKYHLLYSDATYEAFYFKYRNRRSVTYVGANDGMLHAFNGGFYSSRESQFCRKLNPHYNPYDKNPSNDDPCDSDNTGTPKLGAELWAYVPYNLLPHLYWLTETNYKHIYYVDGSPRVFDAQIFAPESECSDVSSAACIHPHGWGTIMVVGMRFGGASITADLNKMDGDGRTPVATDPEMRSAFMIFDITNPEQPPVLLGEVVMPNMGFSLNEPDIVFMKDGDGDKKYEAYNFNNPAAGENLWFLAFGSGPADTLGAPSRTLLNTGESYQHGNFYLLDLVQLVQRNKLMSLDNSGSLVEGLHSYFTLPADEGQSFIGNPNAADFDYDFNVDAIYFGTVSGSAPSTANDSGWKGKMRRIVLDDKQAPKDWIANSILYDARQPIPTAATLSIDDVKRRWVFFGTGRFFVVPDKIDISTQSYYGIKEPLATSLGGGLSNANNLSYTEVDSSSLIDVTNYRVFGNDTYKVDMNGKKSTWSNLLSEIRSSGGWRIDFLDPTDKTNDTNKTIQKGERIVGPTSLVRGALIFTTFMPPSDICALGGTSYLWARYFETGTDHYKAILSSHTVVYDEDSNAQHNNSRIVLDGYVPGGTINTDGDGNVNVLLGGGPGGVPPAVPINPPLSSKTGKVFWEQMEN